MECLPDKAILELEGADLRDYVVVRVADEIVVDLMLSACGIPCEQTAGEVQTVLLQGVTDPLRLSHLAAADEADHA